MSERLQNTDNVSNEDIIEDITKNLNSSLLVENEEIINLDSNAEEHHWSSGDATSSSKIDIENTENLDGYDSDTEYDRDKEENEQKEKESDTDSIDEVSLKDAEVDLTDDQKEERRIIAEDLKIAGNNAFKIGEYERSIEKYTEGLKICPLQFSQQRSILYCNRSAAKMKLERYKPAIKDCSKAIELDDKYLKAYLRRAQSYELTEKLDESLGDFKKVLEFDPAHKEAQKALIRLPPLIEEKNEKLKAEMIGKLKDLGNMILKPFGLSTESFQMEQDPETKGYKINFKQ